MPAAEQSVIPDLPTLRPLGHPPDVTRVGVFTTVDGSSVTMPITATVAVQDFQQYIAQLSTLFSADSSYYPVDSLHRLDLERLTAWVSRLRGMTGAGVGGMQQLPFAEVAFLAEQDTLARRLLDARIAELATVPGAQSLVLAEGVALFADPAQDSARFARNFPIAQQYERRLAALPTAGYAAESDRTDVKQRQRNAWMTMMSAAVELQQPGVLLTQVDRTLTAMERLSHNDRLSLVLQWFPYLDVAQILARKPKGLVLIDSLNARLMAIAMPHDDEWPANIPIGMRPHARDEIVQMVHRDLIDAFVSIGKPAPPVVAHAWLNTPDSAYGQTPRTHPFDDGVIRVLVFGGRDSGKLPMLARVQQHFSTTGPNAVQVLFATETTGSVDADTLSPMDEVRWLTSQYVTAQHVTIPIAIWAGDKVANEYQWHQPAPSPTPAKYPRLRGETCIVIDGRGIVRGYRMVNDRAQEQRLIEFLEELRTMSRDRH